jgi:DNA-binding response OmpR family regulator
MSGNPDHVADRASQPPADPGAIRVLIADDNPEVRALLRAVLGDAGITAVEATDGCEALRLVSEDSPDVVLIDWVMQDGGQPLARDRRAALHIGVDHFFVKPPNTEVLIAAIRALAQQPLVVADPAG